MDITVGQEHCNFTFDPHSLDVWQGGVARVNLTVSCDVPATGPGDAAWEYAIRAREPALAAVVGSDRLTVQPDVTLAYYGITIRGLELGRTELIFDPVNGTQSAARIDNYPLAVLRPTATLDTAFLILLGCLIVFNNFGYGCKIETKELLQIVKKPIAPFVGFCCQFIIMAPVAFGLAKLLKLSDITSLGLLAIGACPGGGGSNIFAYLLDADLELSITMTFISTICALGMTPLWIWGLARFFTGSTYIGIPVVNVFASLVVVVVPITLGVLFNIWKPRYGAMITKGLKAFIGVIGLVFIVMGSVVYYYALKRVTWRLLIACACLSGTGYFLGFFLGSIILRNRKKAVTISLETGFQNLALALMVLSVSLPQPESQLAGIVPIWYTFISAAFPSLAFIVRFIYQRLKPNTVEKLVGGEDEVTAPAPEANGTGNDGVPNGETQKVDEEAASLCSHPVA